jgi:hypothetical protein
VDHEGEDFAAGAELPRFAEGNALRLAFTASGVNGRRFHYGNRISVAPGLDGRLAPGAGLLQPALSGGAGDANSRHGDSGELRSVSSAPPGTPSTKS